ncbi:MAG: Acetate permease ActP (cation/acetate symporter) [uncultured Paraburkholderia sp.]|nr:MAG: Acetate permease ActP (cation/acetate symporter) [uncultured Paraburkholderia sp.]
MNTRRFIAGGGITGFQNGLAIAGDFMSAASSSAFRLLSTRTAMTVLSIRSAFSWAGRSSRS